MKKLIIGVLGIVAVASLYGAKKVEALINISKELSFKMIGLPSINYKRKTVKISIKVTNPTAYNLEASYVTIKNIELLLPGTKPFAKSITEITNISIPANTDIVINNIVFEVHITILQAIRILKDYKKIEVQAEVSAFGQSVKVTN